MFRIASAFACVLFSSTGVAKELPIFVGTYTNGDSRGIYLLRMDADTGRLTNQGLAVETENPSFLAIHPDGDKLYAVNETEDYQGDASGAVSAFSIDADTRHLKLLNQKASGGTLPCHLVVDQTGRNVLLANYGSGSVAVYQLGDDGSLGTRTALVEHEGSSVNPRRQTSPHAHSINLDAQNRFAVAADLGIDRLLVYAFDAAKGTLQPHSSVALAPGAGPRHFAFHPNGTLAFVINEIHSTLTSLRYDADEGALREVQTVSTLPSSYAGGNSTAEVRVSPNGRFVYGSNRGHDSIAVFRVDDASGKLTFVEAENIGGKTPRNFVLDPSGRFLLAAGQNTDNVAVFHIDQATGELAQSGQEVGVPSPVCLRFLEGTF